MTENKTDDPYEHDLFTIVWLEEDGTFSEENRAKLEVLICKEKFPIVIMEKRYG